MPSRRSGLHAILPIAILLAAGPASAADPPPRAAVETIMPWTTARGEWVIGSAIARRVGAHPPFFGDVRRFRRDEWRATVIDATIGVGGGGDVRFRIGAQAFEEIGGESETGVEDARIDVVYRLPTPGVAASLHLGVKLPNAPGDRRLGTDQTDVLLGGAVGWTAGRWGWAADAGIAILGSPEDAGVQDDVLRFGVAGWWAPRAGTAPLLVFGEASGQAASRFTNDARVARAGILLPGRARVHVAARRGLTSVSEEWGIDAGVTISFGPRRP